MITLGNIGLGMNMVGAVLNSARAGRVAHAVLISGPKGTGKKRAARYLAQALVCVDKNPPCGDCPACKKFTEDMHPDVKYVRPDGRTTGVDQIRDLREFMSVKAFLGGRHVAIIEQADKMTPAAQNALLKTLEEPTGDDVIFLVTDAPKAMLPTIVSRCQPVRLTPLKIDDCANMLIKKGIPQNIALRASRMAQGCPERAEEIAGDDTYFALCDKCVKSLSALKNPIGVQEASMPLISEKERAGDILDIFEALARDTIFAQNGMGVSQISVSGKKLMQGVIEARKRLASNVSWQSALEALFISLK